MNKRTIIALSMALATMAALPANASALAWNDLPGMATVYSMPAGAGDVMHGLDLNDTLHGNDFDDAVYGDGGNDFLYGDIGADRLFGGPGADFLSGGQHNDTLNSTEPDMAPDALDCGAGWDVANIHAEDTTDNCEVVNIVP